MIRISILIATLSAMFAFNSVAGPDQLSEKVSKLEEKLIDTQRQLDRLDGDVDDLHKVIPKPVEDKIKEIKDKINSLEATIFNVLEKLATLSAQVGSRGK